MRLKLSIKIPSSSSKALTAKAQRTFARAMKIATQRIVPLVVDRASTMVDKAVPEMAERYKKELRRSGAVQVTEKDVTIDIKDPVVIAVERGTKAFDMKPKLLAHAKKSGKKGGVYVDVAFQHKASSVPQKARAKMAKAAKADGGMASVRLAQQTEGKSFTRMLQRGALGQALGAKAKKQQVQHKRGLHDDMIRTSQKAGKTSSVRYTTVRRISARSAATSWWHPGFKAKRALDKLFPAVKKDVTAIIRDAFATVKAG